MFILEKDQCIGCGNCVDECPNGCLKIEEEVVKHDPSNCMYCGHCLAVCPRDAIMIDGDGYNVEDVEEFQFFVRANPAQVRRDMMMRRSIRQFNDLAPTEEEIARILEAGKYAPTAKNGQNNALLVLQEPEKIAELVGDLTEQIGIIAKDVMREKPQVAAFLLKKYSEYTENGKDGIFYNAPLVIGVFSNSDIDGALCAAYMGQMIETLRLGFCYVQMAKDAMNSPALREKYHIPEDKHCVLFLAIGNYDDRYFCSVPRKDLPLL